MRPKEPPEALERHLAWLLDRLPARVRRAVVWMRRPSARWVRIPAGVLLIIGGLFGFLPVLGLWMLPLGLILLSEDIPALRRLTNRVLHWVEQRWLRRHPGGPAK